MRAQLDQQGKLCISLLTGGSVCQLTYDIQRGKDLWWWSIPLDLTAGGIPAVTGEGHWVEVVREQWDYLAVKKEVIPPDGDVGKSREISVQAEGGLFR